MAETRFIVAGNLIDGSGAAVQRDVFLAVRDGIITAINHATDLPPGVEIKDLSHCTILPPLVDCSVSLSHSPAVDSTLRSAAEDAGLAEKAAMLERHISYCHTHGVLGLADFDDPIGLVKGNREKIMRLGMIEIRSSGPLCRSREDCATEGDFLKIVCSPDIEDRETPNPLINQDDLRRILDDKGSKKSVVVANGPLQVAEALEAGCDAIEQGYAMGEDNLKRMAKNNVLWIPGLLLAKNGLDGAAGGGEVACRFSTRYVAPGKPDPGAKAFWKKTLDDQLSQLCLARELGVKVAIGTGAGSIGIIHGESMAEEMKLFIKGGYSLVETIRCGSENGAEFFGMTKLGRLAVGRKATFLVARGTVKQLPRKLSYLEGIYVDGLPSAKYRKNPAKKGRK